MTSLARDASALGSIEVEVEVEGTYELYFIQQLVPHEKCTMTLHIFLLEFLLECKGTIEP